MPDKERTMTEDELDEVSGGYDLETMWFANAMKIVTSSGIGENGRWSLTDWTKQRVADRLLTEFGVKAELNSFKLNVYTRTLEDGTVETLTYKQMRKLVKKKYPVKI